MKHENITPEQEHRLRGILDAASDGFHIPDAPKLHAALDKHYLSRSHARRLLNMAEALTEIFSSINIRQARGDLRRLCT